MKASLLLSCAAVALAITAPPPLFWALTTVENTREAPYLQEFASVANGGALAIASSDAVTAPGTGFSTATDDVDALAIGYDVALNETFAIFSYTTTGPAQKTWFGTLDVETAVFTAIREITTDLADSTTEPESIAAIGGTVYYLDGCDDGVSTLKVKAINAFTGVVTDATTLDLVDAVPSKSVCRRSMLATAQQRLFISLYGVVLFEIFPSFSPNTLTSASADVFVNFNKATFGQDAGRGTLLGYVAQPDLGVDPNILIPMEIDVSCGSDFKVTPRAGGNVTGGIDAALQYRSFATLGENCTVPAVYCNDGEATQGYVIAGNVAGTCETYASGTCGGLSVACAEGFLAILGEASTVPCLNGNWVPENELVVCQGPAGKNDGAALFATATNAFTADGAAYCAERCVAKTGSVVVEEETYNWVATCKPCLVEDEIAGATTVISTTCKDAACCDAVFEDILCDSDVDDSDDGFEFSCTCPGVENYVCPDRSCNESKKGLLGLLGLLGLIPLLLCLLLSCLLVCCLIRRKKTEKDVHFATFDPHALPVANATCAVSPTFGVSSVCAPAFGTATGPVFGL